MFIAVFLYCWQFNKLMKSFLALEYFVLKVLSSIVQQPYLFSKGHVKEVHLRAQWWLSKTFSLWNPVWKNTI